MGDYLTFDFNGWLDHVHFNTESRSRSRSLGFRSHLYRKGNEEQWQIGQQALMAAREKDDIRSLIDVCSALKSLASAKNKSKASALVEAFWQFGIERSRDINNQISVNLLIPDDHFFGTNIVQPNGKTNLENLYDKLVKARPPKARNLNLELVWRSVATLNAAINKYEHLQAIEGRILVINIGKKITWNVLKLKKDKWQNSDDNSTRVVRTPYINSDSNLPCKSIDWIKKSINKLEEKHLVEFSEVQNIRKWTRWLDMNAAGVSVEMLNTYGIDIHALEHHSYLDASVEKHGWSLFKLPSNDFAVRKIQNNDFLNEFLDQIIKEFDDNEKNQIGGIVIENPITSEVVENLDFFKRREKNRVQVCLVSGQDTVESASQLASILADSKHKKYPAWLDSVALIGLGTLKKKIGEETKEVWTEIIPSDQVIPAGETFFSSSQLNPSEKPKITLAPGIERVQLHLRRGYQDNWDQRYTSQEIVPSDHERVVEPIAQVRPLSDTAQIEVIEYANEKKITILWPIKWSELEEEKPKESKEIPDLYIFKASIVGWNKLNSLLRDFDLENGGRNRFRKELESILNTEWKDGCFPLGSDGLPPREANKRKQDALKLEEAADILLKDFESHIEHNNPNGLKGKNLNLIHTSLTWLFTGCPHRVTELLIDAVLNPKGQVAEAIDLKNDWSAWAIYSGIGRTVKTEESLKIIFDDFIQQWEQHGAESQDKFLVASVTHPLARRVEARNLLNEDFDRFQRVRDFLGKQLENICNKKHDKRPGGKQQASLELRYVVMGYRGLCQIRYKNPDWLLKDDPEIISIRQKLECLKGLSPYQKNPFLVDLIDRSAPFLTGEGEDPTMPGSF